MAPGSWVRALLLQVILVFVTPGGAWWVRRRRSHVNHNIKPLEDLKCGPRAPTATSIFASCKVNAKLHDLVSFMLADADDPDKWPFVHVSAIVDPDSSGTVTAELPGLKPGKAYHLTARSHRRGTAIGWRAMWSFVVVHDTHCRTAAENVTEASDRRLSEESSSFEPDVVESGEFIDLAEDPHGDEEPSDDELAAIMPLAKRTNNTIWFEVFRHAGGAFSGGSVRLPDYLDQHNAADLGATFGSPKVDPLTPVRTSGFTRYCVEVAISRVKSVSTPFAPKYKYGTAMFADYVSCKRGSCHCMEKVDRGISREPWAIIAHHCGGSNWCHCTPFQMKQSHKYVGMAPIEVPPPRVFWPHPWYKSPRAAKHYMPKRDLKHPELPGHWFSFPVAGMCRPGSKIGDDGCNWRMSPVSHSMSVWRLHTKFKVFDYGFKSPWTVKQSKRWMRNAAAAFKGLGVKPCGPPPPNHQIMARYLVLLSLAAIAHAAPGALRGDTRQDPEPSSEQTEHDDFLTTSTTTPWDGAMLNEKFFLKKRYDLSKNPSDEFDIAQYPDEHLTHSCANYTDDGSTVFTRDGRLVLKVDSACAGGDCLNSGRIMSKDSFKYGLYTFSARVPKCNFIWPALWLLPENKDGWGTYGRWPCSGEIDILETVHDTPDGTFNVVSGYGTDVDFGCSEINAAAPSCNECIPSYCTSTTMNWRTGTDRYFVEEVNCSADHPSWDEHVFALSWQPGEIVTYVDPEFSWDAQGHLVSVVPKTLDPATSGGVPSWKAYQRQKTPEWQAVGAYMETCFAANSTASAPFDQAFKLVLNIAVGGYGGAPCSWGQSSCADPSGCGAAVGSEMIVSDISVWEKVA
eukprot:gb/GFBE01021457.1/.p1 GENE.gb/GFBE01021457.1/~~gb/GFBE01021457.1/.p1  ORF type:complete len:850 (+),score=127.46 gb/GFBE01021457.1/:1-2550(+)